MLTSSEKVEALHQILTKEAATYQQLIEITQRERIALQEEDLVDLETTFRDKKNLIVLLNDWEQNREQLIASIAQELQLPATTSLSELISHFDKAIAHKLSKLRQEFINLVEQLLSLNFGNQLLLRGELDRIDATFDYLALATVPVEGNYTSNKDRRIQKQAATGNVLNWQI